jgi:hypothetical protein
VVKALRNHLYPSIALNRLFDAADRAGGAVELHRYARSWGLHVTLGSCEDPELRRAAAFVLADISELEWHCGLLLPWVDTMFVSSPE